MEHRCNDEDMIIIDEIGDMVTSQCPVCKKITQALICRVFSEEYLKSIIGERKQLMFQWTDTISVPKQISYLYKNFPHLKAISKKDMLTSARIGQNLLLGEYMESECRLLVNKAKSAGVHVYY